MAKKEINNSPQRWDAEVSRYIDDYNKSDPKHGLVVQRFIKRKKMSPKKILEIGSFSCKDSRFLAIKNPSCQVYSIDISPQSIKKAKLISQRLKIKNHYAEEGNAFNLKFRNREFDITFHSGFFILFNNNRDIRKLLKEQKRVTRKYMIIFTHHKYSLPDRLIFFVKWFFLKRTLYKIRWWSINELKEMSSPYGRIVEEGGIENWLAFVANFFERKLRIEPKVSSFLNKSLISISFRRIIYIIVEVR